MDRTFTRRAARITWALHLPFGLGLAAGLPQSWRPGTRLGVAGATALLLACHAGPWWARAEADVPLSRPRRLAVEEPYAIHLLALALAVGPALVAAAGVGLGWEEDCARNVGRWAYPVAWLPAAWAVVVRRRWARVVRYEVPVRGLPSAFDGYRIVQLSDVHLGSMTPRSWVERWVAQANRLAPDLVVLTGDYVTSGVAFHRNIADALGALRARNGVIAIMGNHDYYGDGEPMMGWLAERGVTWLRNAATTVRRGGPEDDAALTVVGLDDVYTRRFDAEVAFAAAGPRPRLVLAHDPSRFAQLHRFGADLVLGGHSHWGQFGLPFAAARYNVLRWLDPALASTSGWTVRDDGRDYVHPGLGTTMVPARFGVAPEVTLHVLRPEKKVTVRTDGVGG
ncbi:MAG: metallophosphoesterase [Myxococcota bacterium]